MSLRRRWVMMRRKRRCSILSIVWNGHRVEDGPHRREEIRVFPRDSRHKSEVILAHRSSHRENRPRTKSIPFDEPLSLTLRLPGQVGIGVIDEETPGRVEDRRESHRSAARVEGLQDSPVHAVAIRCSDERIEREHLDEVHRKRARVLAIERLQNRQHVPHRVELSLLLPVGKPKGGGHLLLCRVEVGSGKLDAMAQRLVFDVHEVAREKPHVVLRHPNEPRPGPSAPGASPQPSR